MVFCQFFFLYHISLVFFLSSLRFYAERIPFTYHHISLESRSHKKKRSLIRNIRFFISEISCFMQLPTFFLSLCAKKKKNIRLEFRDIRSFTPYFRSNLFEHSFLSSFLSFSSFFHKNKMPNDPTRTDWVNGDEKNIISIVHWIWVLIVSMFIVCSRFTVTYILFFSILVVSFSFFLPFLQDDDSTQVD